MLFSVILKLLPSSKGTAPHLPGPQIATRMPSFLPWPWNPAGISAKPCRLLHPLTAGLCCPARLLLDMTLSTFCSRPPQKQSEASGFTQNEALLPYAESKHGLGGQHKMLAAFCARLCCWKEVLELSCFLISVRWVFCMEKEKKMYFQMLVIYPRVEKLSLLLSFGNHALDASFIFLVLFLCCVCCRKKLCTWSARLDPIIFKDTKPQKHWQNYK